MSNKILCGGCGKVYPLWIAADAKPANCSDCGSQVEQRHVEQDHVEHHEVPPQFSGGGGKGKAMWIVGGLASMALLMLVICCGVGGAYYYVTTPGASERSQKEAEDRRAQEEMADASEKRRNTNLTDFDKRARDFSVMLKPRGGRMALGMGVADFRNKFPGVALKEPTNPDIPKNAGVWFFVETPTHGEYEEVQGSFVNGRLFELRKTYGAGNFARNDPQAFGQANGDVKKGLLQLIEDIGDAYGVTTVTKTTTTANNESVTHREFPRVRIHMEVQLDRRGKIHVSARKLDIN